MTDGKGASLKQGPRMYKLVVLGDGGVGKSALTMQFVCRQFLDYHDPTIEDAYRHQARIDGEPAQLDILDTAGQPEFTAMREQYMRTGEGYIICYSITNRRSFDEAIAYKTLVNRVRKRDDIPIVLVGNKCDLLNIRQVQPEEGKALAHQWQCPFFESSAATRDNVDATFHAIVSEIRRSEREQLEVANVTNGIKPKKTGVKGWIKNVFLKSPKHGDKS